MKCRARGVRSARSLCSVLLALGASAALAQTAPVKPAAQAHVAPFEDSVAQRMRACVPCHGEEGGGITSAAFPRLAGQPSDYLSAQMRAFRDGDRARLTTRLR